MRRPFCVVLLSLFAALPLSSTGAGADQTDSRLDALFEELRVGDAQRAEENVARIIDIWSDSQSDTVDLLFERAQLAANNGAFDLSLTLLDHVAGLAPNFAQGYAVRGSVRLTNEDRAGAIEDFSKVLELEPRQFEVRATLADLLLSGGDKRAAYEMFQKALEWNPHDDYVRQQARTLRREIDGQEI